MQYGAMPVPVPGTVYAYRWEGVWERVTIGQQRSLAMNVRVEVSR